MPTTAARVPDNTPQHLFRRAILGGEKDTFATVLVAVLSRHFNGTEWFDWEADVVFQEVLEDFGVEMPSPVRDKIWALVTCLTTDRFYTDAFFFNQVSQALSGGPTSMDHFEPASPTEMAWAVLEVGMSDIEDDDRENDEFSDEVAIYVGAVLHRAGMSPVAPLQWAATDTPGFVIDDAASAAMQVTDRQREQQALQEQLRTDVVLLHEDLAAAGASPAEQGSRSRR